MDVNGGWLSGDRNVPIKWYMESIEDEHTDSLRSWSIERELDLLFTENTNQAEWGKLRFTARMVSICLVVRVLLQELTWS